MEIGFIMDPLDRVDVDADTTFAFMLAAQAREHTIHYMRMQDLSARGSQARGVWRPCRVRRQQGDHFGLEEARQGALEQLDVIFMRKDPPFDVPYLHACQLLELAERRGVTVLNRPRGLEAANEKLYALHFEDALPETLVTADADDIKAFTDEVGGRCVLKPIDGHGGEGIFVLERGDRNLNAIIEISTRHGAEPVMCQAYLPEARQGDKRILMLEGEPMGAILRVPREDDNRGNIHVGGRVERAELTERDREICALVGPQLVEDGLWFVGLDVIGDSLTEINVTSPTGIQEMSRLDEVDGPDQVIAWVEQHHRARTGGDS